MPEIDILHPPAAAGIGADALSTAAGPALPWTWMETIYLKGLGHSNLQAQRLMAIAFLQRAWPPAFLRELPPAFVTSRLVPAVGQPHMHRRADATELGTTLYDLTEAFVSNYASALGQDGGDEGRRHQRELLRGLLAPLGRSGNARPLVQAFVGAAAAAAEAADLAGAADDPAEAEAWGLELLALLSAANHALRYIGSGSFALLLHRGLLRTAVTSLRPSNSPQLLLAAGKWLRLLPLPLLQPSGPLHALAGPWVTEACMSKLPALVSGYMQRCLEGGCLPAEQEADAGGLTRLVLLVLGPSLVGEQQQQRRQLVATALEPLQACLGGLYRRPHQPRGLARAALQLLRELLLAEAPLPGRERAEPSPLPLTGALFALLHGSPAVEELTCMSRMATAAAFFHPAADAAGSAAERQPPLAELAELAVKCESSLLLMMQRSPSTPPGGAARTWAGRLAESLSVFLAAFAESYKARGGAPVPGLLLGLVHNAAKALSDAAGHLDSLLPAAAAASVSPCLEAALAHQAAASAGDSDACTRALRLSWYATAGLLRLQGTLEARGAASPLPPELQARLLVVAVAAIATAKSRAHHSLAPQLHCVRVLLPTLVHNNGTSVLQQPALCAAVDQDSSSANGSSNGSIVTLEDTLSWIYSACCKALKALARYRSSSLLASFMTTCLHPSLFDISSDKDPR